MLDSVVVSQHSVQPKRANERLKAMLEVNDLGHIDLGQSPSEALEATALAADYLASVHRHDDIAIRDVEIQETSDGMVLIKPHYAILRLHKPWLVSTKVRCYGR